MNKIKTYKTNSYSGKINVSSIYSKSLEWKIIVPTMVYHYLLEKIEKEPPFKHFKLEIALYFLSLLISIPATKKDKIFFNGYIPLDSKILRKINSNYYKYFDYFLEIKVLQKINYDNRKNSCNSYRYDYSEINSDSKECIELEEIDMANKLKEKLFYQQEKYLVAFNSCKHLIKWFNKDLFLDYDALISSFKDEFCYNKFKVGYNNYDKIQSKALNYMYSAITIKNGAFNISRNKDADNRLHTNFTNMPSKFRKFIYYKNENIISYDIKNSQPYFMIYVLENINNKENIEIMKRIYNNTSIILQKMNKILSIKGFQEEFIVLRQVILEGQFYELLMELFNDIKADEDGKYRWTFFNFDKGRKETKEFLEKRDLIKRITLQILYTPLSKPSKEYKIFKNKFPNLCECIEILKSDTLDKNSYKLFPKLLQHVESDFVLDKITKQLSNDYPEMPIFTIHDSFCTTESWFPYLKAGVDKYFNYYTNGMTPKLKEESWLKSKNKVA